MTAFSLLAELSNLGVKLAAEGDTLKVSPKDVLTPSLIQALKQHKQALLILLEPSRSPAVGGCPQHWAHIPELPAKGEMVITQSEDGQGKRYRCALFGRWYIVRYEPEISETTVAVTCTKSKRRMFASLDEFYRWSWSETFYSELTFRTVN